MDTVSSKNTYITKSCNLDQTCLNKGKQCRRICSVLFTDVTLLSKNVSCPLHLKVTPCVYHFFTAKIATLLCKEAQLPSIWKGTLFICWKGFPPQTENCTSPKASLKT